MKKIEFKNEELKELYQSIIKTHPALASIILNTFKEKNKLIIEDIIKEEDSVSLYISDGNIESRVWIDLDLLQKKIYVLKDQIFKEVYVDIPKNNNKPIAHLYENSGREISERLNYKLGETIKYFELNEVGTKYVIMVDIDNSTFDEKEFVEKILYYCEKYNSIRDLFMFIKENIFTNFKSIKLSDAKGSNIVIENGVVTNYLEYIEEEDQYIKVYLENDEFYYERKVKKPYKDQLASYIKAMNVKRIINKDKE